MIPVYVIKCPLPDTVKKDKVITHYFQGCANIERPALQRGGISGVITVNAWCTSISECAGFISYQDAENWLNLIDLEGAKIVRYGYLLYGTEVVNKRRKVLPQKPAFLLPGDTSYRIHIQPPVSEEQAN